VKEVGVTRTPSFMSAASVQNMHYKSLKLDFDFVLNFVFDFICL